MLLLRDQTFTPRASSHIPEPRSTWLRFLLEIAQATTGIRGAPTKTKGHGPANEVWVFIESRNNSIGKASATSPQTDMATMRNKHNRERNLDAVFANASTKRHKTAAKKRPASAKKKPNVIKMPLVMKLSRFYPAPESWLVFCAPLQAGQGVCGASVCRAGSQQKTKGMTGPPVGVLEYYVSKQLCGSRLKP
jgi:hypothetical protein